MRSDRIRRGPRSDTDGRHCTPLVIAARLWVPRSQGRRCMIYAGGLTTVSSRPSACSRRKCRCPAPMMMTAPTIVAGRRHIAEHDVPEHHRPNDHRILIGHDDAGRRQFQRTVDAYQRAHRASPAAANRPRLPSHGRHPAEWRHQRAKQECAAELRRRQHDIRRRPQRARDQHQERKRQAAADAIIAGQLTVAPKDAARSARRKTRSGPRSSAATRFFAEHDARQRGDEDRSRPDNR